MADQRALALEMAAISLSSAQATSRRMRKATDAAIMLRLTAIIRTVATAIVEDDQEQLEVISGLLRQVVEGGRQ